MAELVTVQVRNQFKFDEFTRRRHETVSLPERVADHLIKTKRAVAIEGSQTTGNGRIQ